MKLYKVSQDVNNRYDTYDSFVVAAENEEEARKIHPCPYIDTTTPWWNKNDEYSTWASKLEDVKVEYIGEAALNVEVGIIVSSFNAG